MSANREVALDQIPRTYSLALRLRDAGVATELIIECLGIEPEAIGPLLQLAEAKLASAMDTL